MTDATLSWDVHMTHQKTIKAPREAVWRGLTTVTAADMPLSGLFVRVRDVPQRLRGRSTRASEPTTALFERASSAFQILDRDDARHLTMVRVARFWRPIPQFGPMVTSWAAFADFDEPGWAKACLTFDLADTPAGTHVVTTTRVATTDARARLLFRAYWGLIRPFAGALRVSLLAAAERRALASTPT